MPNETFQKHIDEALEHARNLVRSLELAQAWSEDMFQSEFVAHLLSDSLTARKLLASVATPKR